MAEFVQQSIEEMIPELEQMQRIGLFEKSETRKILKKRQAFEYKLRRKTKCKEDFLQYIQYEINVLAMVKHRREKLHHAFKRLEIEVSIMQRIHKLFRLVCNRFQYDVKLWLSHIQFAKAGNEKATVSRLFTRMLQVHNKKSELWILAAKWEFEENISPDNARSLMQRGLRFNPESKKLWLEYYRLELLYTDMLRKRKALLGIAENVKKDNDAIIEGKVAFVVYKNALESISGDVNFLLSFIPICKLFDFTQNQEEHMFQVLQDLYSNLPLTWDALAKRHLYQRYRGQPEKEGVTKKDEAECLQVYEEAVKAVPTAEMWSLYLKAVLMIRQWPGADKRREKRNRRALDLFDTAARENKVCEDLFRDWFELLEDLELSDRLVAVSELGTKQFPTSVSLWKQCLLLLIRSEVSEEELLSVFHLSQSNIPPKESWPLWHVILDFCIASKSTQLKDLFEKCVTLCREVCQPAKELYIQWTYLSTGIKPARKLYKRLSQAKPVSIDFYRKYIAIESAQEKTKMKLIRQAYDDAIQDYGSAEADLWLEYVKVEMFHPDGHPENTGQIHYRAIRALPGEVSQEFVRKYTLLQTGNLT
ncbi:U3 small nucleolar RNA-associated protein 6 homolog [Gigantopelta aegis]|uniref:U3 small nucleolar RNA-associated protein 6 homolog n=1 Tax=Gigantopelta aegis TaxID=1735272 RepID=UPI001B88C576|nr:U3 small nucleolar RNA-associated protein 6 homolog [Gigantopelta aegis]